MDWPAGEPENVPAVALPLPARRRAPDRLGVMGFTRTVRLIGDHGEVAHGFVRTDPKGLTFVGEEAARAVDPATFDGDLKAADERQRQEDLEVWGEVTSRRRTEYPVRMISYAVLARNRRETTKPVVTSVSHMAGFSPGGLDEGAKWMIFRMDRP
jgi:hypothetical protein